MSHVSGFLGNFLQIDTHGDPDPKLPERRHQTNPLYNTSSHEVTRAPHPSPHASPHARACVCTRVRERVAGIYTPMHFILGVCHRPCTRRRRMLLRVLNTCEHYFPFDDRASFSDRELRPPRDTHATDISAISIELSATEIDRQYEP